MGASIRTFIAIELPENVIAGLDRLQRRLKDSRLSIRWVRPETVHLTLKFLGDIDPETTGPVGEAMTVAVRGHGPLSLAAKGCGVFPGLKNPRIVWAGIAGELPRLKDLQQALDENLALLGFAREKRPFRAHLTLGRCKSRSDPAILNSALEEAADFQTEPFSADRITLFQSELKPSGPVYTPLLSAALASAPL